MIVCDNGLKQVGNIVRVLHLDIMRQGYLLHQVFIVAHGGKMYPVLADGVVRYMVVCLGAVAGQQEQLSFFGYILAVIYLDVAFAVHYIIKLIVIRVYYCTSP